MIIIDGERNHSMGSPIHRTPHAVIMLTIHYDQQLHTAIIQYFSVEEVLCDKGFVSFKEEVLQACLSSLVAKDGTTLQSDGD